MNYAGSLKYLDSFCNFEKLSRLPANRFWNLDRMRFLLEAFAHPEKSFFPVLIAGTKGKGSSGFFLEAILTKAGIPAGFYSSPHVETPLERMRIGGKVISRPLWANVFGGIERVLKKKRLPEEKGVLTYFEIMTLAAMLAFRETGVKIGIFEVGLGGRLDATNVLDAGLACLTTIGMDHEEILGNTLTKIAREKSGIMRAGADIVVAPQPAEAMRAIRRAAAQKKAFLHPVRPLQKTEPGLGGNFQRINAAVAEAAAGILRNKHGFSGISDQAVKQGLAAAGWPGRFEVFPGRPVFILDAAHNPSAMQALVESVAARYRGRPVVAVFGTSRDKNSKAMLEALRGVASDVILTRARAPRAQEPGVLLPQAGSFPRVYPAAVAAEALALARRLAGPETVVLVTGSFYLVGELRPLVRRLSQGK